jgi:hypothetical protein
MTRPKIRHATAADLDAFYGENRPRVSQRAIVVELDGEILGVAALNYFDGQMTAISEMRDELQAYPVTIMKAARMFAEILDKHGAGVLAVASNEIPRSAQFLERVGFNYIGTVTDGRVYQWHKRQSR